jgi:hypothetical protein
MACAGAMNRNVQGCLCYSRAPLQRSPVVPGRSSLAALFREERRRGRGTTARRPLISTYVAAVEEAPPTESAASTSDEDDEFKFAIDFTNTEDLYKRFNELLERQAVEPSLNDRVTGTVFRCGMLSLKAWSEALFSKLTLHTARSNTPLCSCSRSPKNLSVYRYECYARTCLDHFFLSALPLMFAVWTRMGPMWISGASNPCIALCPS